MRKQIEAEYRVTRDGNKIVKCCLESEVRELEARLDEAVEALRDIRESGFHLTKIECWEIADNFLNKLEKEKSDEV